jgi:exopolyphosphatase/guanosine-5'-triphosphate,3'-diphosphate pyrophosphatase
MAHKQYKLGGGQPRPPSHHDGAIYAAIDLGTNNCRMLMARPDDADFRVVDSFSRIVRLGEGLTAGVALRDDAIERTIDALKVCAGKIQRRDVRRVRGVATEACRRATNAPAFLDRVEDETGLCLETISPSQEAGLILAGSAPMLDERSTRALVFDIGGGSVEVMWVGLGADGPTVLDMMSLPVGVVMLAEHRDGGDYAAVLDSLDDALIEFDGLHGISAAIAADDAQMLGTSGTVTTVGALHLGLGRYDRSRVDGLELSFDSIAAVTAGIADMSFDERAAHPCIGRQRADLVGVGCDVLDAICRRWAVGRLWVADRGIREGLLLAMMDDDDALSRRHPATRHGDDAHPSAP